MPTVYDDPDQRTLSDEELRDITGINEEQEGAMDREGTSGAAHDILSRQENAAKGNVKSQIGQAAKSNPNVKRGGFGVPGTASAGSGSNVQRGGFGATAAEVKAKEQAGDNANLFKGGDDKPKKGWKGWSRRKKATTIGLGSSVALGAGGLMIAAILSGPLQFIHLGQLLQNFHLDDKLAQNDGRMLKAARNLRYILKNEPQKTRMGMVGNYIADKIEVKMTSKGIKPLYDPGFRGAFRGYQIDPAKLAGQDFDSLRDKSPEGIQKYLKDTHKIDATPDGKGNLIVKDIGNYLGDRRLMRSTMRLASFDGVTGAIAFRFTKVRGDLRMKPMVRWAEKKEEKFKAWVKDLRRSIRAGAGAPTVAAQSKTTEDDKGNKSNVNEAGAAETDDTIREAIEAGAAADNGDPSKLQAFRESISGRLTGVGASVIGILCFLKFIADTFDTFVQINVILPMMRMGTHAMSFGNQIQNGKDVDEEQLGYMADLYYDSKNKTSWSDAKSINAEVGVTGGIEIPENARVNPEGNVVTRFIAAMPGMRAACSTVGQIIFVGLTTILGGGGVIFKAVQAIFGLIAGVAMDKFVEQIVDSMTGNIIDPLAKGADRGNFMNYGVRLAANDMALSQGGLPVTNEEAKLLSDAAKADRKQGFDSKSLAYKLFDTHDQQSLISQVLDRQAPRPVDNLTRVASGFLGIGKSFANALTAPFTKALGAVPIVPYNYGFPDYAFTAAEMNAPALANTFQSADTAAAILDANSAAQPLTRPDSEGVAQPNNDNYMARAKTCFGVEIVKEMVRDERWGNYEQYRLKPPVTGQIPLTKDIEAKKNKCKEDQNVPEAEWTRIRDYIANSQVLNAMACNVADSANPKDPGNQACIDIGMN